MRKVFITAVLILSSFLSFSQWNWSNPTPFGYSLQDVHFPDANTGYVVGEKGIILKTTDAGTSWSVIPSGTLRLLRHVWFTDAETGYITADEGFLMKTSDGGESWQELQSGTTETFNDIYFVNDNTGFIAGMQGQLLRTTDAGETWMRAFISIYSDVYSVHFVDDNTGYAAASMRTVYKTTNGGDTWTSTADDPYLDLRSVFFLDASTGFVAGEDNFMMKTTNGGNSWTLFSSNIPVESISFTDELNGYALSFDDLVKTENGGTTWMPVGLTNCHAFSFADANTVFGTGYNGNLYKSEDAGVTFSNYTSSLTNADLVDVHFPDENTGYAIGQYGSGLEYGVVVKTTTAGDAWDVIFDGESVRLNSLFFTDAYTGYIVGGYGKIYKTTDGGSSWDTLASNSESWLTEVFFVNENVGFVIGEGNGTGTILKTMDGGLQWTAVYEASGPVRGIHFVNENTGFAVLYNAILKTVNGGADWTETDPGNEGLFFDIFFVNQDVGYVCGFMGDFFKTTDGGETWTDLSGQIAHSLLSMYFVDEQTGYMCGDGCTFYQTSDGGLHWTNLEYLSCTWYSSVWFTGELTGYLVGGDGKILKTTNGGQVFSKEGSLMESGFTLFPNPATSDITITSGLNTAGQAVTVSIYSCNGMTARSAHFTGMPIHMDISTLAPGIYFLRMETSNAIETKKLVIM